MKVGSSVGSVGHVLGDNRLALGGGDLVVDILALDLGDGVAVLHLDWDQLDLGVVDTVLGDHLTASVLDGGLDRVGNSVDSGSNNWSSDSSSVVSTSQEVLRISLGISLSLGNVVSSGSNSGGITDDISHLLADLLVLDLLGVDSLGGAHVLSSGDAGLGGQDLDHGLTVGGRDMVGHWSSDWSSHGSVGSNELGVSLGLGGGSSSCKSEESRDGDKLKKNIVDQRYCI